MRVEKVIYEKDYFSLFIFTFYKGVSLVFGFSSHAYQGNRIPAPIWQDLWNNESLMLATPYGFMSPPFAKKCWCRKFVLFPINLFNGSHLIAHYPTHTLRIHSLVQYKNTSLSFLGSLIHQVYHGMFYCPRNAILTSQKVTVLHCLYQPMKMFCLHGE
jgi:hypothetical protein